eukprot:TRINITY_DN10737_c0_g1_i1.p1 TRINITY_DN10737_c0_g1~~TRINITY_DN10737_c0_g1_i1.p1  ORF type:complete len:189 (-),score=28.64 TRINITY_DN10737_c0_g1_i1:3-569(-)
MVKAFGGAQNPKLKYQQLLFLAKALPPLPASDHTVDNRVLGCTAQVWVTARYVDGRMVFAADSDSELTKGLAALLIKCLSGLTPQEVLLLDSSFLARFGMQGSVTPSASTASSTCSAPCSARPSRPSGTPGHKRGIPRDPHCRHNPTRPTAASPPNPLPQRPIPNYNRRNQRNQYPTRTYPIDVNKLY